MSTAGDDLDDGLAYDVDFSDQEVITEGKEIKSKAKKEAPKKKRKRDGDMKQKKKQKMEEDVDRKRQLATKDVDTIIDYLNEKVRRQNGDLSPLELADKYFTKQEVRLTADYAEARNLTNLELFINDRFKNMLAPSKGETKFVSVLSLLAIRACDTHRATKDLKNGLIKLINKNKLAQDVMVMQKSNLRVVCLTPLRLLKVLAAEESEVKIGDIKIIIIDNSYLDKKQQNLWDLPESLAAVKELTKAGAKLYFY